MVFVFSILFSLLPRQSYLVHHTIHFLWLFIIRPLAAHINCVYLDALSSLPIYDIPPVLLYPSRCLFFQPYPCHDTEQRYNWSHTSNGEAPACSRLVGCVYPCEHDFCSKVVCYFLETGIAGKEALGRKGGIDENGHRKDQCPFANCNHNADYRGESVWRSRLSGSQRAQRVNRRMQTEHACVKFPRGQVPVRNR